MATNRLGTDGTDGTAWQAKPYPVFVMEHAGTVWNTLEQFGTVRNTFGTVFYKLIDNILISYDFCSYCSKDY